MTRILTDKELAERTAQFTLADVACIVADVSGHHTPGDLARTVGKLQKVDPELLAPVEALIDGVLAGQDDMPAAAVLLTGHLVSAASGGRDLVQRYGAPVVEAETELQPCEP